MFLILQVMTVPSPRHVTVTETWAAEEAIIPLRDMKDLLLVDTTILALVILIVKGGALLHIQVAKAAMAKAVAAITAPAQASARA